MFEMCDNLLRRYCNRTVQTDNNSKQRLVVEDLRKGVHGLFVACACLGAA